MKINPFQRTFIILLILAVTVALDQYSKTIVRQKIGDYQLLSYLNGHFMIEKVENTGAFLSLGDSSSKAIRIIFLDAIPLLLIAGALGYILIKNSINRVTLLAIIFMIGGGMGNIYDRIAHGSVTDFLYINLGGVFHTGVFNVADLFITTGISIVLLQSWFGKKPVVINESVEE